LAISGAIDDRIKKLLPGQAPPQYSFLGTKEERILLPNPTPGPSPNPPPTGTGRIWRGDRYGESGIVVAGTGRLAGRISVLKVQKNKQQGSPREHLHSTINIKQMF
jgi:hypothetical protein